MAILKNFKQIFSSMTEEEKIIREQERLDKIILKKKSKLKDPNLKFVFTKGKWYLAKKHSDFHISISKIREHAIVFGKTRVGKSVLGKRIIREFMKRQSLSEQEFRYLKRIVVNDVKGDYIEEFYNEKDWIIINPFDERGFGIDLFSIIKIKTDIKALVNALIIEKQDSKADAIWINSARDILEASIVYCLQENKKTNKDLYEVVNKSSKELSKLFSVETGEISTNGYPVRTARAGCERAYNHMVSTQAANLLSNFNSYTEVFEALATAKQTIDIRDFLENDTRNILMANFIKVKDAIAPIFSLFFNRLADEILDSDEHQEREVLLFLDEFASLLKIERLEDMLQKGSGFGLSVFLLLQEIQPIFQIYGKDKTNTFINNCANKFFLQITDEDTRKFIQGLLGTKTVREVVENKSIGDTDARDGVSYSTQIKNKNSLENHSDLVSLEQQNFFYQQSGLGEEGKEGQFSYVLKLTGLIDEERDFREKYSKKYVVREDLKLTAFVSSMKEINDSKNINNNVNEEEKKQSEEELIKQLKEKLAKKKENGVSITDEKVIEVNNSDSPFI
jgi:hypothetical protein